jgi:hypothetical protein
VIGINVTHVPYRSGAQATQDLLAGRIDYQCPTGAVAVPQIAANIVKALAVLSKNRASILTSVPSAHEQGLTGFDIPTWYAIFLPKTRQSRSFRSFTMPPWQRWIGLTSAGVCERSAPTSSNPSAGRLSIWRGSPQ